MRTATQQASRCSSKSLVALACLLMGVIGGCLSPDAILERTAEKARLAVLAVRPDADLSGVRASIWGEGIDRAALFGPETQSLGADEVLEALSLHVPAGVRLGVIGSSEARGLVPSLFEVRPGKENAIALPSQGLILVHREVVGSFGTLAHEYGHIASARMGYSGGWRETVSLDPGASFSPEWASLDNLIAVYCLREGEAQMTAIHAGARAQGKTPEAVWERTFAVDLESQWRYMRGAIKVTSPEGEVVFELKDGEEGWLRPNLTDVIRYLAYEGSLARIASVHRQGEELEATLCRVWGETSGSTWELLFPDRKPERSRFADLVRRDHEGFVDFGIRSATRVGALLSRELLIKSARRPESEALEVVGHLRDDILLHVGDSGLLWITEWSDSEAAEVFAGLYRVAIERLGLEIQLEVKDRLVIAPTGMAKVPWDLVALLRGGQ